MPLVFCVLSPTDGFFIVLFSRDVQGPFGKIEYFGRGNWKGSGKKYGKRSQIGLICGGSGVTPMIQLIQAILQDPKDSTALSLLYANKTVDDIIIVSVHCPC